MKKYVVSDLHGSGLVYTTIISYLLYNHPDLDFKLYINGDLIDRGESSASMLLDVYEKLKTNSYPIEYLAGNHELMMMETFQGRQKGKVSSHQEWYDNGGEITDKALERAVQTKDNLLEIVDFISNLKICQPLEEKMSGKEMVLVHAACPLDVEKVKDKRLKDIDDNSYFYLWAREYDPSLPFRCRIGNPDYFTITGHTPNENKEGFSYHKKENYLNIDGGSSIYHAGFKKIDHIPLVQINNEFLRIIVFNHKGKIINGYYFDKNDILPFSKWEVEDEKGKVKKIGEKK